MTIRNALLGIALAFGVMETIDIPDTGAPAAVFAALFFACTVSLWRRRGRLAPIVLALLFTVEATQAHTWKHASSTTKDLAMVLGVAGILAAATFLAQSLKPSSRTKTVVP
jgi:hypothetical protein